MIKRRVAALVAASGFILMAGLSSSAMADDAPTAGSTGTCVTSDGKTFEFTEATPAVKLEPAAGAESITVERLDDGSTQVKEGGKVPADAVPAEAASAVPTTESGEATLTTKADGGKHAVTVTCTAK